MGLKNSLEQVLENWRQGRALLEEVRSLAADLGNEHYAAGVPDLIQLLEHDDEIVRYNAANSLAFEFHYEPSAGRLLAMLASDPDDDCRRVAAGAWCSVSKQQGPPHSQGARPRCAE
jgi:HEAT repeat protein